jgi:CRISPR-associated protein Csb2
MLAIEVELLTGRYAATAHNDRWRAEWPPHPARFFSALVAALHDREPVDADERNALLWLEQQNAPRLDVDLNVDESVGRRKVHAIFVPVNDVTLVGDPERKLREMRSKLAELEEQEQSGETVAEARKTRNAVEGEKKKLAKFVAAQQIVLANPSNEDVKRSTGLLPERRNRQERTFPTVVPERACFSFLWPDAEPNQHLDGLRRLCDRVTRLGHSSSLVRCAIVERLIKPTLVPREGGEHVLRIVNCGQLDRLERAYARHQAVDARVLPARPQRYGEPVDNDPQIACSVFADDWIILERVGGQRPLASRGSDLAMALRRALIEIHGKEDLPSMLSAHDANGERSTQPHLAFVPLPWVGHEHADGSVQGLALVLPRSFASTDRERLLRLLAKWEAERGDPGDDYAVELGTPADVGRPIRVQFRRIEVPSKGTLNAARWCKPSRHFVTATPLALDRHPGNLRSNVARTAHKAAAEAEAAIADACERIGLPRPNSVSISLAPLLPGAQHIRQFSPWPPQPGRTRRARVHAEIIFSEAVRGPLLVGAGRYFGLGLCLPIPE